MLEEVDGSLFFLSVAPKPKVEWRVWRVSNAIGKHHTEWKPLVTATHQLGSTSVLHDTSKVAVMVACLQKLALQIYADGNLLLQEAVQKIGVKFVTPNPC